MSLFAVTREAGPDWTDGKGALQQPAVNDHATFRNSLADEGFVLFAGPLAGSEHDHPQTILAYGMNGRDLTIPHGAPVRLRLETQLGQKSLKYLQRIVVKDEFDDGGAKGEIQTGWAWYMGI